MNSFQLSIWNLLIELNSIYFCLSLQALSQYKKNALRTIINYTFCNNCLNIISVPQSFKNIIFFNEINFVLHYLLPIFAIILINHY